MPSKSTMNYVCDFSRNVSKQKRNTENIYTIKNRSKELSVAIATAGQYQSIELLTESLNEMLLIQCNQTILYIVECRCIALRIDLRLLDEVFFLTLFKKNISSELKFQLRSWIAVDSTRGNVKIAI